MVASAGLPGSWVGKYSTFFVKATLTQGHFRQMSEQLTAMQLTFAAKIKSAGFQMCFSIGLLFTCTFTYPHIGTITS